MTAPMPPDTASLLDWALWHVACDYPVLPCHTPTPTGCSCRKTDCPSIGKHPRTRHGVKDATTNEALIRHWWGNWPEANIAIATGQDSGLDVLDEDTYKGGDAS